MRKVQSLIGITGGIGSGKSTLSRHLMSLSYPVLSLDQITHDLYKKGTKLYEAVVKEFPSVRGEEINRKVLGNIVFNDKSKLEVLNKITHPLIIEEMEREANEFPNQIVFVEVPLLFEANLAYLFDLVVTVYVDKDTQIKRVMNRDSLSYDEASLRVASQLSLDYKKDHSDIVIDGSSIPLIKQGGEDLIRRLVDDKRS